MLGKCTVFNVFNDAKLLAENTKDFILSEKLKRGDIFCLYPTLALWTLQICCLRSYECGKNQVKKKNVGTHTNHQRMILK